MSNPAVMGFPMPATPALVAAFDDLDVALNGKAAEKAKLGDPARLPRPWELATCTRPALRREVWEWLEQVVIWFNHDICWDPNAGMIPACWPKHPHLVHDIALLADQRRRAAVDLTSDTLESWNRYGLPQFLARLTTKAGGCLNGEHRAWPGELRHTAYLARTAVSDREAIARADLESLGPELVPAPALRPGRPQLTLVDDAGALIDPITGEVIE